MPVPLPSSPQAPTGSLRIGSLVPTGWPKLSFQRHGDAWRMGFYKELQLLLAAGVDPATVFVVLEQAGKDDKARDLHRAMRRSLAQGRTLAEAFAAEGRFSKYEQQCVQVGEETGRIAEVFADLAAHYESKVELRRTMVGAIAYPVFVLFVTLVVVAFMLRVVVPMFADVFKRSGAELPALTRAVMRMSEAIGPLLVCLIVLVAFVFGLYMTYRNNHHVRLWLARLTVRLPLVGPIYQRTQFARFYAAMGSMLSAQLPLDRALSLAMELVGRYDLRMELKNVREQVMKGAHLHGSLSDCGLVSPKEVAMIAVAEEVRQLDTMFLRLAAELSAEVKYRTGLMGKVLEPVMIVFIALFVGVVLVAMYLPMFKLSTAF